jgi:hypothetical protein
MSEEQRETRRQNILVALDLGLIAHHTAAEMLKKERKEDWAILPVAPQESTTTTENAARNPG